MHAILLTLPCLHKKNGGNLSKLNVSWCPAVPRTLTGPHLSSSELGGGYRAQSGSRFESPEAVLIRLSFQDRLPASLGRGRLGLLRPLEGTPAHRHQPLRSVVQSPSPSSHVIFMKNQLSELLTNSFIHAFVHLWSPDHVPGCGLGTQKREDSVHGYTIRVPCEFHFECVPVCPTLAPCCFQALLPCLPFFLCLILSSGLMWVNVKFGPCLLF